MSERYLLLGVLRPRGPTRGSFCFDREDSDGPCADDATGDGEGVHHLGATADQEASSCDGRRRDGKDSCDADPRERGGMGSVPYSLRGSGHVRRNSDEGISVKPTQPNQCVLNRAYDRGECEAAANEEQDSGHRRILWRSRAARFAPVDSRPSGMTLNPASARPFGPEVSDAAKWRYRESPSHLRRGFLHLRPSRAARALVRGQRYASGAGARRYRTCGRPRLP